MVVEILRQPKVYSTDCPSNEKHVPFVHNTWKQFLKLFVQEHMIALDINATTHLDLTQPGESQ